MIRVKAFSTFMFTAFMFMLHAQNGEIAGKIVDANGEGIYKATIIAKDSLGSAIGKAAISDHDGNFSIRPLLPGKYNLEISAKNYSTVTYNGLIVRADRSTFVNDIHLSLTKKSKR